MSRIEGIIIRSVSGFYYVKTADSLLECRARGLLRKGGITPYAGDRVVCEASDGVGTVLEVLPRRNFLIRPPTANIDRLVIVASLADPVPNLFVIDKMTAVAQLKEIEPVLVFTKTDLVRESELPDIYRRAGFRAMGFSSVTDEGIGELRGLISGGLNVFTGNSGVGKSSLLNRLMPGIGLQTGEISHKLGRGRHTTRVVELHAWEGGYLADTPGFSALDLARVEPISKEELPGAFREFAPFLSQCLFNGCTHVHQKGCAVEAAVERGDIPQTRYESYVRLFTEMRDIPEWEKKR